MDGVIYCDTDALNAVVQLEAKLVAAESPYELITVLMDGVAHQVYRHAPLSLKELYHKALQNGSATLAVFGERHVSYEEVLSEAALLASILRTRFAVGPGVRVALVLECRPEWLVAFVAVTSVGATAVLIDAQNTAAIPHCFKLAECALAIMEHDIASKMSSSLNGLNHLIKTAGDRPNATSQSAQSSRWDELLEEAQGTLAQEGQRSETTQLRTFIAGETTEPAATGDAIIAFTSGTTGPPKGVVLTHVGILTGLMNMRLGGLLANAAFPSHTAKKISAGNGLRQRLCSLVLSPLSHIGGYSQLLLALTLGGRLVLHEQWDAGSICRLIDREKVRSLVGATPAQIRELMRCKPEAGSLTSLSIHGTALHRTLLDEITAQWPRVTVNSGYGMTETNGSIASISGETLRRFPHCAGQVVPTVEVRIVGPGGFDVEPGAVGEVWLRGASLMRGYCTEGGSVEGLADGWFKTGDLGCLSPHRFLSVVDRVNHVLEAGNRRISALEIERAVACDTGVAEAVVLCELTRETRAGRQDEKDTSVVVVVVPKFGATLDGERIRRIVVERASIEAHAVTVVEAPILPKTRSGKVNRGELRAMLAQRSSGLKWLRREAPP